MLGRLAGLLVAPGLRFGQVAALQQGLSVPTAFAATAGISSSSACSSSERVPSLSSSGRSATPASTSASGANPEGPPAFVFDIDGVLVRGPHRVLPQAQEMAKRLCEGTGQWRHPVCFLTNGGGCTEEYKAEQLSHWLQVPVSASQVILSHTPMRDLVPRLGDQPVLITGLGKYVDVARGYGFKRIATTEQLGRSRPESTPFASYAAPPGAFPGGAPERCPVLEDGLGSEEHPFKAILFFTDPNDWYRDLQLVMDVITGNGVWLRDPQPPGSDGISPHPHPPVELYFSHGDLLWVNAHPRTRLAQGAFAEALAALHMRVTGRPLPHVVWFGKPMPAPYRLAEQSLLRHAAELGMDVATPAGFSGIYAVGDNPAADVRGANAAGAPWVSVLVRTGVFQGPVGSNSVEDPAHIVVDDVLAAVTAALHRARSTKWHSLR